MERTLIAVFDNRGDAQSALDALIAAGFSHQQAALSAADPTGAPGADTAASNGSIVGSIKHFLSTLFGTDNSEHVQKYSDAVTRGHHVLTLSVTHERELARAATIIERWGPVDIDDTSVQWATGTPGGAETRKGARAQQQATPMSRQSMQGAPGSMQGVGEGAAASQAPSQSQFMSDSQQRAVGIDGGAGVPSAREFEHLAEPPLGVDLPMGEDESYFRRHYNRHYAGEGNLYIDYAPAYEYGLRMASEAQYRGRAWKEVAPQLRTEWERRHPGASWSMFEAAVRHGWEKTAA
ncbi:MAG: hypothetical protein H7335_04170 [Massilia sp.]|nr:hypothetical protein [Massilia sp.]